MAEDASWVIADINAHLGAIASTAGPEPGSAEDYRHIRQRWSWVTPDGRRFQLVTHHFDRGPARGHWTVTAGAIESTGAYVLLDVDELPTREQWQLILAAVDMLGAPVAKARVEVVGDNPEVHDVVGSVERDWNDRWQLDDAG